SPPDIISALTFVASGAVSPFAGTYGTINPFVVPLV
ncbi:hypothetical protein JL09_g5859, partial [Pichia kudriavzevii]